MGHGRDLQVYNPAQAPVCSLPPVPATMPSLKVYCTLHHTPE